MKFIQYIHVIFIIFKGPADVDVTVPSKTEDSTPETDSQAELLKKEILEILQKVSKK